VVADVAKLEAGREECYTRELAADHEAYLSGHDESPGQWYGQGSASLGLEGEASVADFQRRQQFLGVARRPSAGRCHAGTIARWPPSSLASCRAAPRGPGATTDVGHGNRSGQVPDSTIPEGRSIFAYHP
jgi:hypothetical protein